MSNSDHSNETKSSIGKNAIVGGVDLCAEISNVLKSMMPSIEKETLKKYLTGFWKWKMPLILEMENAFDLCKCSDDHKV
ncbi:hypothetical protein Tco_0261751 [Tanacetum coccineum]